MGEAINVRIAGTGNFATTGDGGVCAAPASHPLTLRQRQAEPLYAKAPQKSEAVGL